MLSHMCLKSQHEGNDTHSDVGRNCVGNDDSNSGTVPTPPQAATPPPRRATAPSQASQQAASTLPQAPRKSSDAATAIATSRSITNTSSAAVITSRSRTSGTDPIFRIRSFPVRGHPHRLNAQKVPASRQGRQI
ncbi:hypothetical protein FI667_g4441, partial [Globisporangium splendens]